MAKTFCKASVLVLLLMVLTDTDGARIRRGSEPSKTRTSHEQAHMYPLQLDPKALVPMKPVRALHNASISPWTYNTTHDPSLFPPYLSEARCLFEGCLNQDGHEDRNLESRPIMHQVLLLRRVRSHTGQAYHYKLEPRLIAVGCTCVRPVVQHQH